jgi:hypothetical protein
MLTLWGVQFWEFADLVYCNLSGIKLASAQCIVDLYFMDESVLIFGTEQ